MIKRDITIDGKAVAFRASATVPRLYRLKFGRDIIQDITKLQRSYAEAQEGGNDMDVVDLEIFENIAYIMAKHADQTIPDTINDWLDCFSVFSIYTIAEELFSLWELNAETLVTPKKK